MILIVDAEKAFNKIIKVLQCNKNYWRNYSSYGDNHSPYYRELWGFNDLTHVKILRAMAGTSNYSVLALFII